MKFENIEELIKAARKMVSETSKETSVYVGCDSVRIAKNNSKKKNFAKYSVVVIVHKNSNNGCDLHYTTVEMPEFGNLKQRLLTEVGLAIQVASELVDILDGRHMEVHLDVNPNPLHKSNIAVKEALGYVQAMGLNAVIKPDSFAATHAADHAVRGKSLH